MNEASAIEAPPDAPVLPTSTRRPRPRTMPGWRGLLDTLLACIAPGSLQAQSGPVPPGGDPALACGQRPEGRSYWTEYGFCDMAVRGPAQAKGLVLWSHGVDGRKAQYQYPPPPIVRALALSGWDVVKINRNALAETEWYSTGVRHTDDALLRAQDAKARGYKAIILAGQSYGGGISIEANTKALGIDGVLALSPGYGSDATLSGENYRQHSAYLLASLSRQKGGRVVVLSAARDMYHPDRSTGSGFGGEMRKALAASRRPFVVFDETAPIRRPRRRRDPSIRDMVRAVPGEVPRPVAAGRARRDGLPCARARAAFPAARRSQATGARPGTLPVAGHVAGPAPRRQA